MIAPRMLESTLAAVVENLLAAYGIEFTRHGPPRSGTSTFRPDFVAHIRGSRTAIEVKPSSIDARELYLLFAWYDEARHRRAIDRLLLVTRQPPSPEDAQRFHETFERDEASRWIPLEQLPPLLGIHDEIDFGSPQVLHRLQTASLMRKGGPANQPIGLGGLDDEAEEAAAGRTLPASLRRQLSKRSRIEIERSGRAPEKALRIGEELRPYVLMSDLKSFSTLVRLGDADAVQDMMTAYYRGAREIIWRRGAILDKFIGDAVLAIWGYPEATGHDVCDAVRAGAELIALGRSLLEEFQSRHNEVIDSGTRIGIARDEVLVLNIGAREAELSFVGNAINLAARLQAASAVDGMLVDNRTHAWLAEADGELHRLAAAREVVLDEHHVKGQLTDIRAWQIARDGVERLLGAAR
jgi:adenylate cyclase